jgi:hypothetical protein
MERNWDELDRGHLKMWTNDVDWSALAGDDKSWDF